MSRVRFHFYAFLGVLTLFMLSYQFIDRPVISIANHWHSTLLYRVSEYLTLLGTPKLWIIAAIFGLVISILTFLRPKWRSLSQALLYISLSILLAVVVGECLKYGLGRYRPIFWLKQHLYGFHFLTANKAMQSTPSGHTLAIFAIATSLGYLFRQYRSLLFIIALSVAFSRIVLIMHFPSDVLAGAYVGIMAAVVMRQILPGR